MIIKIDKKNINKYLLEIADVHYSAYSTQHFTSCFSKKKLAEYYLHLILNSDLSLISLNKEKKVDGFIVAGYKVGNGVSEFIKKNRIYLLGVFLFNPKFFIEKINSITKKKLTPKKDSTKTSAFRLMSISVDSKSQSKGIGGTLLNEFEHILKSKNIDSYGLSVRKENKKAIRFYINHGFNLEKETKDSVYYGKKL